MIDVSRAEAYIDKSKHEYYEMLKDDANSIFYKMDYTDIFISAAAVGFYNKKTEPIKGTKQSIAVLSLIRNETPKLWILKSIAISVKGIEVLNNLKEVASTVEGYANAGIDILIHFHKTTENEIDGMALNLIDIIELEGIPQK